MKNHHLIGEFVVSLVLLSAPANAQWPWQQQRPAGLKISQLFVKVDALDGAGANQLIDQYTTRWNTVIIDYENGVHLEGGPPAPQIKACVGSTIAFVSHATDMKRRFGDSLERLPIDLTGHEDQSGEFVQYENELKTLWRELRMAKSCWPTVLGANYQSLSSRETWFSGVLAARQSAKQAADAERREQARKLQADEDRRQAELAAAARAAEAERLERERQQLEEEARRREQFDALQRRAREDPRYKQAVAAEQICLQLGTLKQLKDQDDYVRRVDHASGTVDYAGRRASAGAGVYIADQIRVFRKQFVKAGGRPPRSTDGWCQMPKALIVEQQVISHIQAHEERDDATRGRTTDQASVSDPADTPIARTSVAVAVEQLEHRDVLLPDPFMEQHAGKTVRGAYKVFVDRKGKVYDVKVVSGLGRLGGADSKLVDGMV